MQKHACTSAPDEMEVFRALLSACAVRAAGGRIVATLQKHCECVLDVGSEEDEEDECSWPTRAEMCAGWRACDHVAYGMEIGQYQGSVDCSCEVATWTIPKVCSSCELAVRVDGGARWEAAGTTAGVDGHGGFTCKDEAAQN